MERNFQSLEEISAAERNFELEKTRSPLCSVRHIFNFTIERKLYIVKSKLDTVKIELYMIKRKLYIVERNLYAEKANSTY